MILDALCQKGDVIEAYWKEDLLPWLTTRFGSVGGEEGGGTATMRSGLLHSLALSMHQPAAWVESEDDEQQITTSEWRLFALAVEEAVFAEASSNSDLDNPTVGLTLAKMARRSNQDPEIAAALPSLYSGKRGLARMCFQSLVRLVSTHLLNPAPPHPSSPSTTQGGRSRGCCRLPQQPHRGRRCGASLL